MRDASWEGAGFASCSPRVWGWARITRADVERDAGGTRGAWREPSIVRRREVLHPFSVLPRSCLPPPSPLPRLCLWLEGDLFPVPFKRARCSLRGQVCRKEAAGLSQENPLGRR